MAEEKKVPISELETIDDVIQKHPQLIEFLIFLQIFIQLTRLLI